jgi:hypothetical protein
MGTRRDVAVNMIFVFDISGFIMFIIGNDTDNNQISDVYMHDTKKFTNFPFFFLLLSHYYHVL